MDQHVISDIAHTSDAPEELVMTLELVADESEGDPALVNAVGRDTVAALQQEGDMVRPVYTGQKEGFLVEVVTMVTQLAITAWDNRAVAGEVIADLSGLVTIFAAVLPKLKQMLQAHEQRVGKEESTSNPMKIVIEIDGVPLSIGPSDVMQDGAAHTLALQFRSANPIVAPQVTTKSKVKVQGRVPTRKRRRHR
jgi:hypothetical protein